MMTSILAGFMIALGGSLYLTVGESLGALLFSIGLLTILSFKLSLFTGKAGLLATKDICPSHLLFIWLGNFIGCAIFTCVLFAAGLGEGVAEPASAIVEARINNVWYQNVFRGIICGVLMFVAVSNAKESYITIMCVVSFILLGANHCVADMAYTFFGATKDNFFPAVFALICTTIGNIVGCNIIPIVKKEKAS